MRHMSDARSYLPGTDIAFVGTGCALLLPAAAGPAVDVLWPLIRDGAEVELLLEALAAGGMRAMPPFALLHGRRIVLRATGQAQLGDSAPALTGAPFMTWAEHLVDDGQVVRLGLGDAPGDPERDGLPLIAGVVRAAAVSLTAAAGVAVQEEDDVLPAPVALRVVPPIAREPEPARPAPDPEPELDRPVEAVAQEGRPAPIAAVPASPVPAAPAPVAAAPVAAAPVEAAPVQVAPAPADPEPAAPRPIASPDTVAPDWTGQAPATALVDAVPDFASGPGEEESYDHLFGDTVHRSLEDAGVRPATADDQPPVTAPDTDHDGSTILRSDLAALRGGGATASAPATGAPQVLGVRCDRGHANPPGNRECRSCGDPLPDVDPVLLARPSLGRLRVSDGSQAELDRTVLIGRQPTATRFSRDEMPHLLIVGGQQQDISRTHVEVQVDDWNVLVVDRSSNGTWLVRPGADPQRLHSDEPVLVLPGSVLDLGDGVTIRYEAGES